MRSNPLSTHMKLRRTGTMEEYKAQILPLLTHCRNLDEWDQIDTFTGSLRIPLQTDVELQCPQSLDNALGLARAFEHRLELDDDDDDPAASSVPRVLPRTNPAAQPRPPAAISEPHTPPLAPSRRHQHPPKARHRLPVPSTSA